MTCNLCGDPTTVGVDLASQLYEITFQAHDIRRCRLEMLALVGIGIDFTDGPHGDWRIERERREVLSKRHGERIAGTCGKGNIEV